MTDKVVGAVGPIVGGIIGTLAAGNLQAGVQIGGAVAKGLDALIGTLSDIFDFLNMPYRPGQLQWRGAARYAHLYGKRSTPGPRPGGIPNLRRAAEQRSLRRAATYQGRFFHGAAACRSSGRLAVVPEVPGAALRRLPDFKGVCPAGGQHEQTGASATSSCTMARWSTVRMAGGRARSVRVCTSLASPTSRASAQPAGSTSKPAVSRTCWPMMLRRWIMFRWIGGRAGNARGCSMGRLAAFAQPVERTTRPAASTTMCHFESVRVRFFIFCSGVFRPTGRKTPDKG